MNEERRKFLKVAGTLATGFTIAGISGQFGASCMTPKKIKNFGLQLYTLRDVLPADPKGVLKKVASFGYKQIESYEHEKLGMYWGMTGKDFKNFLEDIDMKLVSSHCDHTKNFEKKADDAAAAGIRYVVCPWLGPQKKLDFFKDAAEGFNKAGEICKQRGMKFAYHNHDYSFKKVEGEFPQDVLMQNTDKSLVEFEMDMFWVSTAGHDPVAWLKKYPKRFTLAHVKDGRGGKTSTLGTGAIDYPSILKEAENAGMKYFFVEQEDYVGTTPIDATKDDAEYMKKLRFKK